MNPPTSPSPGDLDRISEVLPYLYIGSYGAAENAEYLNEQNITHLVCLLEEHPRTMTSLPSLCTPMSDYGESDIRQVLTDVAPFIEGAKEAGGHVLIFCALGVNRSPALVAGYLRVQLGCTTSEALNRIISSRPFISVHEKYLTQLEQLDGPLLRRRHLY
jgi:protein-tyrosine phosphatase